MSTDLVRLSMEPRAIDARIHYAKALAASSIIPDAYRDQPANVLVAVETGAALGIPAIQALSGIAVIKGKAAMSADLMSAVVRRAGHRLRVTEHDGAVTATLIRADDPDFAYEVTWDRAKAERAGLWGQRGPWALYPGQMLRARAVTEVCRQGASDALMGVTYAPEELGATVDEDGEVIDAGPADLAHTAPDPDTALAHEPESTPPWATAVRPVAGVDPAYTRPGGPLGLVHRWLEAHGMDPAQTEPLLDAATEDEEDKLTPRSLTAWLNRNAAPAAASTVEEER